MSAVSITSTVASPEKTDHNLLTSVHHRGLTTHFSRRICGPRLAHYSPPKPPAQWFHPPVCGDSPSPSAPLSPPRLGRRARIEFPVRTGALGSEHVDAPREGFLTPVVGQQQRAAALGLDTRSSSSPPFTTRTAASRSTPTDAPRLPAYSPRARSAAESTARTA